MDKYQLIEKAFKTLRLDPKEHPLMLVDNFSSTEEKEKVLEFVFAKLDVPAVYFAQEAIVSAFASGKSTALVVSSGHKGTVVTPVYDGYVLQKGVQKQSLGGQLLSDHVLALLKHRRINIVPQCQVKSKKPVDADKPASFVPRDTSGMKPELLKRHVYKTVHDFKETLCQTLEVAFDPATVMTRPVKSYEFPDGFNTLFQAERFHVPEVMFNPKLLQNPAQEKPFVGIQNLIHYALQSVDTDLRALMYQNIVVTGGNISFPGFIERLQFEMNYLAPGVRCRLHAAGTLAERRYAAWIGGSILASLGTFHQLWISKEEYEELGSSVLDKR